jgi:shikimate dehydrogenase
MAWALKDSGFRKIGIASRNFETGSRLASDFGLNCVDLESLPSADLMINATPIGMTPHSTKKDPTPFTLEQISSSKWIIESVASPPETQLVRISKDLSKSVISGYEITILQAVEQFHLYTGTRPSPEAMQRAAASASSL